MLLRTKGSAASRLEIQAELAGKRVLRRDDGVGNRQAQQADLGRLEVEVAEELFGEREDLLAGDEGMVHGDGVRFAGEVGEGDFEGEGVAAEVRLFEPPDEFRGDVVKLDDDGDAVGEVLVEGVFAADGFPLPFRSDGTGVDAPREVVVDVPVLAEVAGEEFERATPQVGSLVDAEGVHLAGGDLADAPEGLDGEAGDEVGGAVGMDGVQPVRLAVVGRYLGEEFVVGDSGGGDEAQFLTDFPLDGLGDVDGEGNAFFVLRDVEERLVEGERLHDVGVLVENLVDLGRHFLVDLEAGRHEDESGAQAEGADRRHGGVDSETAGLVAGGGHDSPPLRAADGDGLAAVLGVVALLDGGVEGVHVDVYDFPLAHESVRLVREG